MSKRIKKEGNIFGRLFELSWDRPFELWWNDVNNSRKRNIFHFGFDTMLVDGKECKDIQLWSLIIGPFNLKIEKR